MEARTERRAPEVPRVPIDVLVQLSHEDFEEPFDADGVDVSSGGLALRSDYLPEIGDRLRCRFDCPPDGTEIEVDGEVVWAHDAGERSGEFGMRFTDLDEHAEDALRKLIAHVGGAPIARSEASRVRLHLEKVATPLEVEVIERADGWITVEQELPFLSLGMNVSVEGLGPARGKLASVDLRLEGGVPRLLLVVEHEAAREPADDRTLEDYVPPPRASAPVVEAREIRAREIEAREIDEPERTGDIDALTPDLAPATPVEPRAVWQDWVELARDKAIAASRAALERARPALAAFYASALTLLAKIVAKGGPRVKAAGAKVASMSRGVLARIAARAKGKRRTAPPPRVTAMAPKRRAQREEPELHSPKRARRIAILSLVAFAGVGIAVYALAREDVPEPTPTPLPVVAAPAPPAVIAAPPPPVVAPVEQAQPAPEPPLPDPRAMPEPQAEAGQLGEPTYPSLREASAREAAPAPSEGSSFGAAQVPNGRAATIRMSQPVTTLRGQREPDGFTVTIPGALALDRAGPIAQANPSVERAMILNRGDHSVLTIRFVAGRNPPYRVVARGPAIEIIIGR